MFVTHDVDEALVLGDRIVVLGRYGVVSEHPVEHPGTPNGRPARSSGARVLQELSNTQSLAPIDERRAVA